METKTAADLKLANWIGGRLVPTTGSSPVRCFNPANGELLNEYSDATESDVAAAVANAENAYKSTWNEWTPGQRSDALFTLAALVDGCKQELAAIETLSTGKPLASEVLAAEMPLIVDQLRFFASSARDNQGLRSGEYTTGKTSIYRREPLGVVALITPWNYPLMMAAWKIGAALAAGCSAVIKPAPTTPFTTLRLAQLCVDAGIPPGVVNVVIGTGGPGRLLVKDERIRGGSFTGSTRTGAEIMRNAADRICRVHLELGGKAAAIVMPSADLEKAASSLAFGAVVNSGQDCVALTRLYVHRDVFDQFAELLTQKTAEFVVGDPMDSTSALGPLVSDEHRHQVQQALEGAVRRGARIHYQQRIDRTNAAGYYFPPTIVTGLQNTDELARREVFGPVLMLADFADESEALTLANGTEYGLAASVWTRDVGQAMRITRRLEAGTVWVNDYLTFVAEYPHGGVKQSGFGSDLSRDALREFTVAKHVVIAHD